MKDINGQQKILFTKIKKYIDHSYLTQFIKMPTLDEDKLFLLVAMCNDVDLNAKELESYIVSSMLVQVALDIHEDVSITNNLQEQDLKIQQLKVLAGDYYSGLYYSLLAQLGDTEMIKNIARSIKTINEHKIEVYQDNEMSTSSFIKSIKVIESEILRNMAEALQLPLWETLIPEILLLKRLYQEQAQSYNNRYSIVFQHLLKVVSQHKGTQQQSSDILEKLVYDRLNEYINSTRKNIDAILMSSFLNTSINERLQVILDSHSPIKEVHQIVEEG
jgi:heptaprenyl diphosphate synthase